MISEARIEEALDVLFENIKFDSEPIGLYEPLDYMIRMGGKRARPRLCLTVFSMFKPEFSDEVLFPAAALEVFHSFTLIHDDIMDKAKLRRGLPTVCEKWDDNTAILSGDVMSIESYRFLEKASARNLPKLLNLFSTTAAQVCQGQQYDMDFEVVPEISMSKYLNMIGLKTAVLMACAAKMGAVIAEQDETICDAFYKFGYDLGLAFQITDDYLDTYGDSDAFGKEIGGDILNNKKTWILTRALEKAGEMEKMGMITPEQGKMAIFQAMNMGVDTPESKREKIEKMKEIFSRIGIDEDVKYEIIKLNSQAMSHITNLGLSKLQCEKLNRFANKLIGRTR